MKLDGGGRTAIMAFGLGDHAIPNLLKLLSFVGCDLARSYGDEISGGEPVLAFNDRILESAGTSGNEWTSLNAGWRASPKASEFKAAARNLLADEFGDSYLFALGNSGGGRLLAFWQDVFADIQVSTGYVMVLSDPVLAATDLAASTGMPVSAAQLIWLRDTLEGERHTRGRPRCIIAAETLDADWSSALERIGKTLGLAWPRALSQAEQGVNDWLGSLAQLPSAVPSNRRERFLSDWVRGTYQVLQRLADGAEEESDYAILDAIGDAFDDACLAFAGVARDSVEIVQRLDALETGHSETGLRLTEAETSAASLREELDETKKTLRTAQGEAERLRDRLAKEAEAAQLLERDLRGRLSQLESALRQRQAEADEYSGQLIKARRDLADMRAFDQGADRAKDQELATLSAELRSAERSAAALLNDLENADRATRAARDDAEQYRESALETAKQLERAREVLETLEREHATMRRSHAEELADARAIFAQQGTVLDILDREKSGVEKQLNERYGEVVILTRLLSEASEAGSRSSRNADWAAAVTQLAIVQRGKKWHRSLRALMPAGWQRSQLLKSLRREGLFDPDAYLLANPDVARAGVDPLRHFLEHGISEGRPRG